MLPKALIYIVVESRGSSWLTIIASRRWSWCQLYSTSSGINSRLYMETIEISQHLPPL